jgi:hypothetical protein
LISYLSDPAAAAQPFVIQFPDRQFDDLRALPAGSAMA